MRQEAVALWLLLAASTAQPSLSLLPVNVTIDTAMVHLLRSDEQLGEENYVDRQDPLKMVCRAEVQSSYILTSESFDWRKLGSNESLAKKEPRADHRADCGPGGLKCMSILRIRSPGNSDLAAAYECHVTPKLMGSPTNASTVTATGRFLSMPLITLKVGRADKYDLAVWPTETVSITCSVEGHPPGDIRWTKERDPGFNLTGNMTLTLSGLSYERDRGMITCVSRNDYGTNRASMFLRVKSPTAFVAPLVAIGVELLTMLAIVVSYEICISRRKGRQAAEDADGKTD